MLEFPTITPDAEVMPAAAPAPRTEVATAAAQALDLKKIDLKDVALAQFGDWRAAVAGVKTQLANVVHDLPNQAKVDDAKSLRWRLIGKPRADARVVCKELKSTLAKVSKAIGAEEEAIVAAWDEAETLITPQIDAAQTRIDAEKAEKARIEREAQEALAARLAAIGTYLTRCQEPGMTAERIQRGMDMLAESDVTDADAGRADALTKAKAATLEAMRLLHAQAVSREAEAARQEAIRLENERVARELAAERERIAAEAAAIRRQAEELAAQRAESERLERLAVENRARLVREAEELARTRATVTVPDEPAATAGPILPDEPDAAPAATVEEMGGEAPDAGMALQDDEYPEGLPPQQVLKAEPETADATDRGTAADASPRVGAMGAGQPADAGPAVDRAVPAPEPAQCITFAEPEPLTVEAELQALAAEARASRFPSQPKMGLEWWTRFYALADRGAA